jgi:hypothetical protein
MRAMCASGYRRVTKYSNVRAMLADGWIIAPMTAPRRGSRLTRPWRHLRRWWLRTPTEQAAISMIAVGVILLVIAALIFYLARRFG